MANELTINASIAYDDGTSVDGLDIVDFKVTLTSQKFAHIIQSVGTSEEAMILGEVTSLGFCIFKNLDPTNYVEVRTGTGGTKIVLVSAGSVAMFAFGSGITAPFLIANTATCRVEYLLISQ